MPCHACWWSTTSRACARRSPAGWRPRGWRSRSVGDGHAGLPGPLTGGFDAIVLDIILPGLSGYRVLEQLRAAGVDTPVLLLSAKDGEFDQADGLDLGADGYLVKPFSFVVLVAQLRAMLRRRDAAPGRTGQRVRLGALRRRPGGAGGELGRRGRRALAARVRAAARAGVAAGHRVSKDDLLRLVWGDEQAASRNVVEVYVGYVRRKLDAVGAGHVLRTVRGYGYLVGSP